MAPATTVLGKRKRVKQQKEQKNPADKATRAAKVEDDDAAAAERAALEEAQAIFRRHFEAQFVPLQEETEGAGAGKGGKKARGPEESDDDSDGGVEDLRSDSEEEDDDDDDDEVDDDDGDGDDAWDGLSGENDEDDEDENRVQVVDHSKPLTTSSTLTRQALMGMTKKEMRAYLSSKPPDALSEAEQAKAAKKALAASGGKKDPKDDADAQNEDSKALLANDLELQRLISESHILSASNPFNTTTSGAARLPFAEGRTRALTTDMRVRALGSKGSIFTQQKMPMGMRKGIAGARAAREERRRREARENGIILERPAEDAAGAGGKGGKKGKKKATFGRRDLPVDMPGMGRMKGGELRLSKRDVRAVENEGRRMDSGGKKKRKRR
ncbi:hypothetical protein VPNG_03971 [Cytospora leucostoma]|uniref:Protein FAF1 n=1 Tax=Cytospora leucostoma TaxID=1230097 RepID=A0A423XE32_9PEZI|nr:hypothetical protein VPNG_03971 [Cytospora leucostoma]